MNKKPGCDRISRVPGHLMNDLAEDAEMIRYAADTTADKRILLKHAPTTRGGGGDKGHGGGGR